MINTQFLLSFSRFLQNVMSDDLVLQWEQALVIERRANEEAIIQHNLEQAIILYEQTVQKKRELLDKIEQTNPLLNNRKLSLGKTLYCLAWIHLKLNQKDQAKPPLLELILTLPTIEESSEEYNDATNLIRSAARLLKKIGSESVGSDPKKSNNTGDDKNDS